MTKRRKIALWCLSHLSVMALGFLAGIAVEHRYGKKTLEQMLGGAAALQGLYIQYVELQRERGGYEEYRDALLDYNQLWELGQQSPLMSVFHDHSGRMFNYLQLWRLESQQGAPAAARRYIDLALDDCAAVEWRRFECTPETLRGILEVSEQIERNKVRTRTRRDKEADDTLWIGPRKLLFPPREGP